jgi:hypothetical protein
MISAPTSTPSPTSTPTPTLTPTPSNTPTRGPLPPKTATPENTDTPHPTETPDSINTPEPTVMPGLGLGIVVIFYLLSLNRGAKIFLKKHFSILYLILYLCTLEFLPLLLVYNILLI